MSLSVSRRMPGTQPTVETPVRRCVMPTSGSRARGAEHVVDVHQRLAHAHEHEVVDRLDAAEVQDLVEDLARRQVAAELHRPGRAERAGQRAARLRGDADRAAAVAVAHEHGLDRPAVGGAEQRLDRPVGACASLASSSVENGTRSASSARSAAGQVGHRVVAGRAGRGPAPHLAGAERGLAELGQRRVEEREVHAPLWWQRHAPRQVPRPRGRRLAPRRRAARVRRARHRRRRGGARSGARRGGARRGRGRRPRASRSSAASVVYALNKPAGYVSTAKDPQGRPTVVSLVDGRERLYPVGPARRRHHRPAPAHERRRARPPAHPPLVRGPARLPRAGAQPAGARARAPAAARGRRARRRRDRARRARAGSRPTASSSSCTRAASGRCGGCSTPSGTRSCGSSASRSARCGSATCRSGGTGPRLKAEVEAAAQASRAAAA